MQNNKHVEASGDQSDESLVAALRELSRCGAFGDGLSEVPFAEAADRLESLSRSVGNIRDAIRHTRGQLSTVGLDYAQVAALVRVVDELDARVV